MSPGAIEKFEELLQDFSESERLDLIAYVPPN